ncbi:FAD-binding domain-containing protein [Aurantiacibacter aquimixticola]|uniref:DNA photolyase n=1 Tax=Aurantiacibacter aquimixticola TaxID=1958945 RepID=A0A419RVZ2_9SPHN|nr:FAD-binding domain-containing protein [Aurantiacibacter aquimixticola]RJY09949.1 DNA photolyase [Aurantiacibacter aquimixticola]
MQHDPSRSAGLARLDSFVPRAARQYADTRNHDRGEGRDNVSQLSPWLHAGLISEHEVLEGVLAQHPRGSAEKFISEVFWRVYFKGYLEQHPSIWRAYCEGRDAAFRDLDANSGVATAYREAIEGRTGIEAFDHWARELAETGYLHNHARMWFASIWIFTLKLNWHLGADFFLRHLMDGDAASNTLSWRWVAGLHTKGKTYLARAGNIARYTAEHPDGPFAADGLADEAQALDEDTEHQRTDLDLPEPLGQSELHEPYALLLHDEAASHEPLGLAAPPSLIVGAARPDARSLRPVGEHARNFALGAVRNGMAAARTAFGCEAAEWDTEGQLGDILRAAGATRLVMPFLPTGWTRDALWPDLLPLADDGRLTQFLPDLQRQTFPQARAGFFRVRKAIPDVLQIVGLPTG